MSKTDALRLIVREIDRRLVAMPSHASAVRLMTAAFVLTGLRVEKDSLGKIFDGVRIMHETVAWDALEESYIKGRLDSLIQVGTHQIGKPDAKTLKALKAIQDAERLSRMIDGAWTAKSWKALLSIK